MAPQVMPGSVSDKDVQVLRLQAVLTKIGPNTLVFLSFLLVVSAGTCCTKQVVAMMQKESCQCYGLRCG